MCEDLFWLMVWNINMCKENRGFFHLIGLCGLFKTRLFVCLKYPDRHCDFSGGKDRIWNSSNTLTHGASLATVAWQEGRGTKSRLNNADEEERIIACVFHLHIGTVTC